MTRDTRLVALFGTLTVAAAALVGAHVASAKPPVDTDSRTVRLQHPGSMSVTFLGDTMLADGAQASLNMHGYDWPFQFVRSLLDADFTIANAEAPITDLTVAADPLKPFSYAAAPDSARALAVAGVDGLGLANNHSMDVGPLGLADTIRNAQAVGMTTLGAGDALPAAQRPLLLRSSAGTLAVVAFGENFGKRSTATDTQAGTLVVSPVTVQRGVDVARAAGADWVVAYVHWGDNYAPVVPEQRAFAAAFQAAGYDMVIGTGPHVVQPIQMVAGMPVAYSIGNFAFGAPGRFDTFHAAGYGLGLRLELSRSKPARVTATCLRTDNTEVSYQPRPCTKVQSDLLFPAVSAQLAAVSPDTAVLRCACLRKPR